MGKLISIYFSLLIAILISSCKKADDPDKDLGQYSVAISYSGSSDLALEFFINGHKCGTILPTPNVNPTYVDDCNSLDHPSKLTNVFVLKKIPVGKHKLEVKNTAGNLVKVLEFEMLNKECIFQELAITFN